MKTIEATSEKAYGFPVAIEPSPKLKKVQDGTMNGDEQRHIDI